MTRKFRIRQTGTAIQRALDAQRERDLVGVRSAWSHRMNPSPAYHITEAQMAAEWEAQRASRR